MLALLRASLLLFLAACGTGPDDTVARTFDPCATTPVAAAAASTAQSASIDDAIALWRDVGVSSFARDGGDGIAVVFKDAPQAFYGFYDDELAVVYVNERIDTEQARAVTLAHELGHALGLSHVPATVRASVMNVGNVRLAPTAEDVAELTSLWGACPPPQARASSSL